VPASLSPNFCHRSLLARRPAVATFVPRFLFSEFSFPFGPSAYLVLRLLAGCRAVFIGRFDDAWMDAEC